MKVFSLYPDPPYAGGVILLIAANTVEEAQKIARSDEYMDYYGDMEHIEEVKELSTNVDTPKVILGAWYIE